jgi:aminocarboxymuconate-semialdehyde decarboxylase
MGPPRTCSARGTAAYDGPVAHSFAIKFLMVHGGGFVPYRVGRFKHGWEVRAEPRARLKTPPQASLDKLVFDTIVHGRPALEFLISSCGAERALLGSDYSFDMGTLELHGRLRHCRSRKQTMKQSLAVRR